MAYFGVKKSEIMTALYLPLFILPLFRRAQEVCKKIACGNYDGVQIEETGLDLVLRRFCQPIRFLPDCCLTALVYQAGGATYLIDPPEEKKPQIVWFIW